MDGNATVTAVTDRAKAAGSPSPSRSPPNTTPESETCSTLPTPSGEVPFKVAATTTNLTWSPGAILMSTADYSRFWATSAPTALGVDLQPGANVHTEPSAIERTLGPASGLEVSRPVRATRINAIASEGLGQLGRHLDTAADRRDPGDGRGADLGHLAAARVARRATPPGNASPATAHPARRSRPDTRARLA